MKWMAIILALLLAFNLGCSNLFTNEERGQGPHGPSGDDDTDDDAADDDTADDDIAELSAAVVYAYNSSIPSSFESWGGDFYINADSYRAIDVPSVDLSKYDVIILAKDLDLTIYYNAFQHIQDAHKPIVAMFRGTTYLNEEGTHWYNFETENCPVFDWRDDVYLMNTGDDVFKTPWTVQIPDGSTIQLTTSLQLANACNNWNMPQNVVALAAIADDQAFITIGYESNTYIAFWGFDSTPFELTTNGQYLLANLIHHTAGAAK